MRLDKVKIKNYKSIEETDLDLGQSDNILSLVGQNESGKSSILEAVRDFYNGEFDDDSFPYDVGDELEQAVSCTFSFEKSDKKDEILEKIEEFLKEKIYNEPVKFLKNILSKVSTFTIVFDGKHYKFDEQLETILINNIEKNEEPENEENVAETEVATQPNDVSEENEKESLDGNIMFPDLPEYFVKNILPEFIFFEGGECDTLPDFISIEDLANSKGDGWIAVTWLEKCLQELTQNKNLSFQELSNTDSLSRRTQINQRVSEITADFKQDFSQKIHGIENDELGIEFNIEKRKEEEDQEVRDYVDFAVKTKEGKALPVRMRSKGMIWFLSFWLALKSLKEKKSIILVDEPDRSLHINAQKDLLGVFEKISKKYGHQIIYATHAPSLVPLDTIYRIFLIFNDKNNGTLCENILKTQIGNSKNKQEAISLVNYAIGCSVPYQNLIFKKENVILEGTSDFMHFQAMTKILEKDLDLAFIPGVGAIGSKLNPLVGICIGYNFKWCVIIDGGNVGETKFNELKEGIFAGNKEKAEKKIKLLSVENIEDLFSVQDIELIAGEDGKFNLGQKPKKKDNVAYIGKSRKNVFAKLFLDKANIKEITKDKLSPTTVNSFEKLFDFIPKALEVNEFE
jgi:predicted ATP-dependent endonuclease of OLD family